MKQELIKRACNLCAGIGFFNNVQAIPCQVCNGTGYIFVAERVVE